MRLLLINTVCGTGSTGRIAADIAKEYEARGWDVRFAYGRGSYVPESCKKWAVRIGNTFSVQFHGVMTRIFDFHANGICSRFATKKFLRWAEGWKPDLIWLHNLHGYYINYELLFEWIKLHPDIEVKWTLHDCWAFTGHCCHFLMSKCNLWKDGCSKSCPERNRYPASFLFANAKYNWERKKQAFCGVRNLSLITPSKWLAGLTRTSFLNEYPIRVLNNSVDKTIFKPTPSDFRERFGLHGKIIILGVATDWDRSKGFNDFIELRNILGDEYSIVLVGMSRKQIDSLPLGVVGIQRTSSPVELAKIYSAADWFFNPTHEDTYPTVNLEAQGCGCKVVTYDVGGSAETVEDYDKAWVLRGVDMSPNGFRAILRRYHG